MIPKICATALLTALLSVFLGEMGFKSKKLLSILAILLLLGAVKEGAETLIGKITELSASSGLSESFRCALKAVGTGYLFGITSDVCTELGEVGVAKAVNIAGKIEIMLIALPYFEKTLNLGLELLQ